ncbi:DUF4383 domain-containing protein [Streptomyces sedi]|uniref:DUF4383 domain-containing protein n=1 Tax=Streptomyces sedi TaxID=555059 RepID=A0A5C4VD49_9ACTN|nr:DUF4383 domain-containing protein [Streptomyces sedi]TNM33465.1 DUF4383 domain-containing protein [Streptomyces sedi]
MASVSSLLGTDSRGEPRLPEGGPLGLLRRATLERDRPADRRLNRFYRIGAGLIGLALVIFGVLGVTQRLGAFSTGDDTVWGMNTNGALSWLSVVVGLALGVMMLVGGSLASVFCLALGALFVLSGFAHLAVLSTGANVLNFGLSNVFFSFAVGLALLFVGMYGRVSGRLPHDNPFWRARHPEAAVGVERRQRLADRQRREISEDWRRQDRERERLRRPVRRREARRAAREESSPRS